MSTHHDAELDANSSSKTTSTNSLVCFDVDKVLSVAKSLSSHSWEYGITTQALLEWYNITQSVFSASAFPSGKVRTPTVSKIVGLKYASTRIDTDASSDTLAGGDRALGDPASLLPPAILMAHPNPPSPLIKYNKFRLCLVLIFYFNILIINS